MTKTRILLVNEEQKDDSAEDDQEVTPEAG